MTTETPQRLSEAVEALMRKSRISTIATILIALVLGGSFLFLGVQISREKSELDQVTSQVAANRKTNSDLQAQNKDLQAKIDQNRQILAESVNQARLAVVNSFERRFRAQAAGASPGARSALTAAITQATAADSSSGAGRLVYVQYTNPASAALIRQLQANLVNQHGYVVPGIEQINRNKLTARMDNVVRYFVPADRAAAAALADAVNSVLLPVCKKMQPLYAPQEPTPLKKAPPKELEVWVVNGC